MACCFRACFGGSSDERGEQMALEDVSPPPVTSTSSPTASTVPSNAANATSTTTTTTTDTTSTVTSPIASNSKTTPESATTTSTATSPIASTSPDCPTFTITLQHPLNSNTTLDPSFSTASINRSPSTSSSSSSSSSSEDDDDNENVLALVLQFTMMKKLLEMKILRARTLPSPLGEDLCQAAHSGDIGKVTLLLGFGADVNYVSGHGYPPLNAAFYFRSEWRRGNPAVVLLLLGHGAYVDAIDVGEATALHRAAYYDVSGVCVALLIGAGADVDCRDGKGATPLHWAAMNGNESAVVALLTADARKNVKCWGGGCKDKTPLDVATSEEVRRLLQA